MTNLFQLGKKFLHKSRGEAKASESKVSNAIPVINTLYFDDQLVFFKRENKVKLKERFLPLLDGVKSKIAQYYILDTFFYTQGNETLLSDIIAKWLLEVKGPLERIYQRAQQFEKEQDQAIYFAMSCLNYLLFGENNFDANISDISESRPCPFTSTAWNFMLKLVEDKPCLCQCYATFIRAAAEEYDYDANIYMCNHNNSSSIMVVDDHKLDEYPITAKELKDFYVAGSPEFLRNTLPVGSILRVSKPLVQIKITSEEKINISITTCLEEKAFSLFLEDNISLESIIKYENKLQFKCEKIFNWNDVVTLMKRIVNKKNFPIMIGQLFCVGFIYGISEVIDNIILIYSMYKEKDFWYKQHMEYKAGWSDYMAIKDKIQKLINNKLGEIYDFMVTRTKEPYSISAVLSIPAKLLAVEKEYDSFRR